MTFATNRTLAKLSSLVRDMGFSRSSLPLKQVADTYRRHSTVTCIGAAAKTATIWWFLCEQVFTT